MWYFSHLWVLYFTTPDMPWRWREVYSERRPLVIPSSTSQWKTTNMLCSILRGITALLIDTNLIIVN